MASEVFALVGRIALDGTAAVTSGLQSIGRSAQETGQRMEDWGDRTSKAGEATVKLFGAATLALGGILAGSVVAAANFEEAMSNVQSVMSPDEANEFGKALEGLAIEMGEKTKYSALEAAKGIEELLKAGVGVTDIINGGLEGALNLATAGELDLGEAAQIASTALNAFTKENLTVAEAADILAGAAVSSATDVREMQYGLSQVAAVANSAGMSFGDTSLALAVFAQNGLKGSDAGTSLKTMLSRLQPTTKAQKDLFEELGLNVGESGNAFFDAEGRIKSFADISQVLQDSLGGMNEMQRSAALTTLFGSDAVRGASIAFEQGAAGANAMSKAMSGISAADVAAAKMDNLKGKFEEFTGGLETAAITVGTYFIPALTAATGYLQKAVNWFNGLSESQTKFIAVAAAVTLGVLALITGFGILLTIIGQVAAGVGVLMGASMTIIGPILAVVAVVGLLVAAFVLAYNKSEEFRNVVSRVFGVLAGIVQQGLGAARDFIMQIWGQIQEFWAANGEMILQAVRNVFNFLAPIVRFAMNLVVGTIVMYWNIAKGIFQGAVNVILGIIQFFAALFTGNWSQMWEAFKQILMGALQIIWGIIQLVFMSTIMGIIRKFGGAITGYIGGMVSKVVGFFRSMGTAVTGAVNNLRNAIVTRIDNIALSVAQKIANMSQTLANTFLNIVISAKNQFNAVKTAIVTPIQAAQKLVGDAITKIKGFFSNLKLKMPKIQMPPMPHFEMTGKFSLNPPQVPKLGINWYAQGGVFDGASVIGVGEQPGVKEAVIPLSGQHMRPFAEAIAALIGGTGGGDNFHIEINARDIREFNDLIRILQEFRQSVRTGGAGYGTDTVL